MKVAAAGFVVAVALALSGCRSADPACAGRTAADFAPTESQFGAMSRDQRRADAARFNELARRCGWEP